MPFSSKFLTNISNNVFSIEKLHDNLYLNSRIVLIVELSALHVIFIIGLNIFPIICFIFFKSEYIVMLLELTERIDLKLFFRIFSSEAIELASKAFPKL